MSRRGLSPVTQVKRHQAEWAAAKGIVAPGGYTQILDDNLFSRMSPETRTEFAAGDGAEPEHKMRALHSSSALAVNVFDYWRGRDDRSPLASALGLASITEVRFEQKRPTGLRGNAPNLDILLVLDDGSVVAIESKFLEPYGAHVPGLNPKYLEHEPGLWTQYGFSACQSLAEKIGSGEQTHAWLYPQQLLKHVLGLSLSEPGPWTLYYLWYSTDSPLSQEHALEVGRFAQVMAEDGISFRAMTYQELFAGIERATRAADQEYVRYLRERYFDWLTDHQYLSVDGL